MPITCYIHRFYLTHQDRLGKILHLRLRLLRWTLKWKLFLGKCWAMGDFGRCSHGVHLYRNQIPHPIEDWHTTFLQAITKWATFLENHASLCSSTLIWPQRVVGCHYRHPWQCLHSWCINAAYHVTYHFDIFPITLLDSKESIIVKESQRDSLTFLRLHQYMLPMCMCPILRHYAVIPMLHKQLETSNALCHQ